MPHKKHKNPFINNKLLNQKPNHKMRLSGQDCTNRRYSVDDTPRTLYKGLVHALACALLMSSSVHRSPLCSQ